jgi:lipoprotein-releasing system permease protein
VYKLLLCWRYLLTRYLALACIISIMLGVATLIVVNSVMSGFSTKLKQRLHGLLSDVLVESAAFDGMDDPDGKMQRIWNSPVGDKIEAMTPTIEVLGLFQARCFGQEMAPRAVHLIGVNAQARARVGGFKEFLTDPRNQVDPSFEIRPEARQRHDQFYPPLPRNWNEIPEPLPGQPPRPVFDDEDKPKEHAGVILGYALAHWRKPKIDPNDPENDVTVLFPGDEIVLHTVAGNGQKLTPVYDSLVVVDYFKSEMSEYDSMYVFVPLEWLQKIRNMENRATAIQIKLKDFSDAKRVVKGLEQLFPPELNYRVETWEQKQGALLAAIAIEKGILNVLLFLIVGVAGFGILAIFTMIVVEKTRDIGILKALGASNAGVMKIFLSYGLLLGLVGALLGTMLGVTLTVYVNEIEHFLGRVTGQEIFPREVYYFDKIPTDIQPWSVLLINLGAVGIAVIFSVLPALRAALLHPVRALRYE